MYKCINVQVVAQQYLRPHTIINHITTLYFNNHSFCISTLFVSNICSLVLCPQNFELFDFLVLILPYAIKHRHCIQIILNSKVLAVTDSLIVAHISLYLLLLALIIFNSLPLVQQTLDTA